MIDKLSIGTAQFGLNYGINNKTGKVSFKEIVNILDYMKSIGIRNIDTARGYGDSEKILGRILKDYFSEVDFDITTKIKYDKNLSVQENLNLSLQRLNQSKITTVLFHSYDDYKLYNSINPLENVRKIGVSVYTIEELKEVSDDSLIDVIQIPFNLFDNESVKGQEILYAKSRGKEIQIRSVFLQGLFFMNKNTLPVNIAPLKKYLAKLEELSTKYNISIRDMALKYVFSKSYIDNIIIGIDSLDQLKMNLNTSRHRINPNLVNDIESLLIEEISLIHPVNW